MNLKYFYLIFSSGNKDIGGSGKRFRVQIFRN